MTGNGGVTICVRCSNCIETFANYSWYVAAFGCSAFPVKKQVNPVTGKEEVASPHVTVDHGKHHEWTYFAPCEDVNKGACEFYKEGKPNSMRSRGYACDYGDWL